MPSPFAENDTEIELSVAAAVERIQREVAAPAAGEVDREGAFPAATVAALRASELLGLLSARDAGPGARGAGLRAAALVVERLAEACGSSAMVACMHYCGALVVERLGAPVLRRGVAAGEHLCTLAFSEAATRSRFWTPAGTARRAADGGVRLDAEKSWVTSARHASIYVWSSRALEGDGVTLWAVPARAPGLRVGALFDGLGLRGNDSSPVSAGGVTISDEARLGADGDGLGHMMGVVLPAFNLLSASCSIGLMSAALTASVAHAKAARFGDDGSIADLPTARARLALMRLRRDQARALRDEALAAVEAKRGEASLLAVLEAKAAADDAALAVTDLGMRLCGGAAFRKELGVERLFRDARAAAVMGPTTDALLDFIGKALCGLPLL